MQKLKQGEIKQAVKVLREGGIIAYPTEGVFGLGCDPFNETAVLRLLKIKQRKGAKGLILIASNWQQVKALIKISSSDVATIKLSGTKPITWIFPATKRVPSWVSGKFNSVAIRVTSHPIAKKLCQKFKGPMVSTSANLVGRMPAKSVIQARKQFAKNIDFVVNGQVGNLNKSTEMRNVRTNKTIRK
jgi:L-threonylcarbamoyladenylate synthase